MPHGVRSAREWARRPARTPRARTAHVCGRLQSPSGAGVVGLLTATIAPAPRLFRCLSYWSADEIKRDGLHQNGAQCRTGKSDGDAVLAIERLIT